MLARTVLNKFGYLTKNQCVEQATNVGKELIDIFKSTGSVTDDVLQQTVKKYIPKSKVNIFHNAEDVKAVFVESGTKAEDVEQFLQNSEASYFYKNGKSGILVDNINSPSDIASFSHELEHYLYSECSPVYSISRNLVVKIMNFCNKLKSMFPAKKVLSESTGESLNAGKELKTQMDIRYLLGIDDLALTGGLKGVKPDEKSVLALFNGKNYTGIDSNKRLDVYLRQIIRGNYDSKTESGQMFLLKQVVDDEARAYSVSDKLRRYSTGSSDVTEDGFNSTVLSRASNVLKSEIIKSLKNSDKAKSMQELPESAYIGKRRTLHGISGGFFKSLLSKFEAPHVVKKISISELEEAAPHVSELPVYKRSERLGNIKKS